MRYFVTGCAGFIGSNLVDRLLQENHEVVGYDNFSTGLHSFFDNANKLSRFTFAEADLLDGPTLTECTEDCDLVFHLAAKKGVKYKFDITSI